MVRRERGDREVRGGILTVLTTVKDATAERLEGIFGWKKNLNLWECLHNETFLLTENKLNQIFYDIHANNSYLI